MMKEEYGSELIAFLEDKGKLLRRDCIKCIGVGVAGHLGILQYSALAEAGFFPVEDLLHCKEPGFYLQGHPHLGSPGAEAGTGSLGQGTESWSWYGFGA